MQIQRRDNRHIWANGLADHLKDHPIRIMGMGGYGAAVFTDIDPVNR